jgi:hypothetical protein
MYLALIGAVTVGEDLWGCATVAAGSDVVGLRAQFQRSAGECFARSARRSVRPRRSIDRGDS